MVRAVSNLTIMRGTTNVCERCFPGRLDLQGSISVLSRNPVARRAFRASIATICRSVQPLVARTHYAQPGLLFEKMLWCFLVSSASRRTRRNDMYRMRRPYLSALSKSISPRYRMRGRCRHPAGKSIGDEEWVEAMSRM